MATSTLLPVFRESVSLSSSRGMTVYNLPALYPAPGLGIVVGVVAMTTNILLTYPKISTPYSKKQLLRRSKRSFFYNPLSAVSTNHSLRMTHAKAISALIKEHKGFGDYMNRTDFSPFGLAANEKKGSPVKKFQCKSKKNNDHESSGPNICAIVVGSSFCIAIAIFCLGFPKKLGLCHTTVVPYSCLIDDIRAKRVTHVQFVKDSSVIYYNTKTSVDQIAKTSKTVLGQTALVKAFASSKWQYQTVNVGNDNSPLIKWLDYHRIAYGSDPKPLSLTLTDVLSFIFGTFPYFIFLLLECYLISTQLNLGKKRKKRKEQPVTFADVEGVGDAKAELLKIVSCLNKDKKDRKLIRSKLPKGVLLTGPPGTGKTLLARALATEAGVSFHAVSATEFVEIYVGMGAARVRELFEKARKSAPSIIFIDEIDAVGGQRGRTLNSESDNTLNQLLIEMDGFYKDDNVMVLAATNIPEKLDPALLRAGRFTTKVVVGLPDQEGRRKIFDLYMRNVPMQKDKENICDYVASRTEGLVGSDLREIADESERLAAHRDGEFVTFDDVRQAVDRAQQNYQAVKMMRLKSRS